MKMRIKMRGVVERKRHPYLFGTMTCELLDGCGVRASGEVHLPCRIDIIEALRTQLGLLDLGNSNNFK